MGNGIEAVQNTQQAQQPSTFKRVALTLSPLMTAGGIFAKELVEGKNIYEAGNKVKQEFNSVHDANKKQLKENVKNAAEQVDKTPFLFGLLGGLGIKALNNVIN